ncbi:MAG: hypothetical protein H7Y38_08395 [Armatimonadetes bacterium]|nr:hypothetical protein [Armatimonadota bacterium]
MNKYILALLVFGFGIFASTPVANAAPLSLFNTGSTVAQGATDPNWTLGTNAGSYGASLMTASNGTYPLITNWLQNDATSKWLVPNGTQNNHAAGDYDFLTSFDLTGFDPASASVTFRFAVDNSMNGVFLNSTSLTIPSGIGFTAFSAPVTVNNTTNPGVFTGGVNTLRFSVNNAPGASENPTGLRVEISGTANVAAVVPESGAGLLALLALPLLGAVAVRRK